jgi:hypothetical protein
MKSLKDYLAESEQWMTTPAAGDVFAFELPDEVLCETYIIEVVDDCILLDSTPEINAALAEWATLEDTDEGDTGIVMETMGYGNLVGEEDDPYAQLRKDAAARVAQQMTSKSSAPKPGFMAQVGDKIIGGVKGAVKGFVGGTAAVKEGSMKREMMTNALRMSLEQFKDRYGDEDWVEEFWRVSVGEPEQLKDDQDAAVVAGKEAAIDAAQRLATDEAKYQGREVTLNKPMAGDVKKSKVYVRDPATGNIKKVNFGHGGKTAKRLGQKTMKIKKSNPARRKSFRARHNCDNPGPKTKARYWSCRAW